MANLRKTLKLICTTMLILTMACSTAFASNPFTSRSTIVDQASGGYTKLTIYRNHPDDSTPFQVKNMLPGDSETHTYYLAVSYRGSITVHFHADIKPGYEKLAEVLKCRVILQNTGECLYDGLMRDMPASLDHKLVSRGRTTDELYYEITSYLETSVGNDYMAKELFADFRWWAAAQPIPDEDDYYDPDEPKNPSDNKDQGQTDGNDTVTDQTEPGSQPGTEPILPGELVTPPKTGDISLGPILLVMGGCLFLLIILLSRKRREEEQHEQ